MINKSHLFLQNKFKIHYFDAYSHIIAHESHVIVLLLYRCEASTMELAPRNKELYKNLYKNEFPSLKVSPFDAEFNSASNGDTFIHGKTIEKNFT